MRGDTQSHEVVHDEAVEHATEKMLDQQGGGSAQAEERVCRDASRRKNRCDERQPVRGTRHIAVGEAWSIAATSQACSCV